MTVKQAMGRMWGDPWGIVFRRWNWKSAIFGALIRGAMFYVINRKGGKGFTAMTTEFLFFVWAAGFFGAVTQAFRHAIPGWLARLAVMVLVISTTHTSEYILHHWIVNTPHAMAGTLASICFTILSTIFSFYVMSRGAMVIGEDGNPFLDDMKRMPVLLWNFVGEPFKSSVFQPRP